MSDPASMVSWFPPDASFFTGLETLPGAAPSIATDFLTDVSGVIDEAAQLKGQVQEVAGIVPWMIQGQGVQEGNGLESGYWGMDVT